MSINPPKYFYFFSLSQRDWGGQPKIKMKWCRSKEKSGIFVKEVNSSTWLLCFQSRPISEEVVKVLLASKVMGQVHFSLGLPPAPWAPQADRHCPTCLSSPNPWQFAQYDPVQRQPGPNCPAHAPLCSQLGGQPSGRHHRLTSRVTGKPELQNRLAFPT